MQQYPKFIYNVAKFAMRPSTVQRDEYVRVMWHKLCNASTLSIPLKGDSRELLVEKNDLKKGYAKVIEKEFGNATKWERHLKRYSLLKNDFEKIAKRISKAQEIQMSECKKTYLAWISTFEKYSYYFMTPFALEVLLDPECRKLCEKEFDEKAEDAFAIISTPTELNIEQKIRIEMLDKIIKGDKSFENIAKKYFWMTEYSFVEPLANEEYFKKQVEGIGKEEAQREKEKIIQRIGQSAKDYETLAKKIKDKRLKLLAEMLNKYTVIRTDRICYLKMAQAGMRKIYAQIADELKKDTDNNWNYSLVPYCTNEELFEYLKKKHAPDFDEVKKRVNEGYVYYSEKGRPHFIYGEENIKEIVEIIEKQQNLGDKLKGIIAFKGKATGKARIILGKSDLHKVGETDILVARVTIPDYIPAMKKAIALVTEEGGITSHAAISAREMRKPCIVGIKGITKVLKDGDLIEVDAEKGIVKVIK
ncbi:MAG: PEP-utilizing enzyme [archaeon]